LKKDKKRQSLPAAFILSHFDKKGQYKTRLLLKKFSRNGGENRLDTGREVYYYENNV
jgi:hypothetical protein